MGKNEHILEQNMLAKMESLKVVSNMVILNHNYVTIGRMASICPHSLHGPPLINIYHMYEVEAFLP